MVPETEFFIDFLPELLSHNTSERLASKNAGVLLSCSWNVTKDFGASSICEGLKTLTAVQEKG
jgi:hypothetical protein